MVSELPAAPGTFESVEKGWDSCGGNSHLESSGEWRQGGGSAAVQGDLNPERPWMISGSATDSMPLDEGCHVHDDRVEMAE